MEKPNKTGSCRSCGSTDLNLLIDLGNLPIAHRFPSTVEEDEERFPMRIDYCGSCGLGQIQDPVSPEILYLDYNYCFTSWKPEPHRPDELRMLSGLALKRSVLEIGSNDGLFLEELRDLCGYGKCVGIEPNGPATARARERGFEVYEEFLNEELKSTIQEKHGRFDLITSRQVLEHVADFDLFFGYCRELLEDDGALFIDVPDVEPLLRAGDCTLAWEEHMNYFTEGSLTSLMARQGFRVEKVTKYPFSGGCLSVLARKGGADPVKLDNDIIELSASFSARAREYVGKLRDFLAESRDHFDQVLLYGVGCRSCALVNGMDLGGVIDACIDDQMERQGKFLPGARLPIEAPASRIGEDLRSLILLAVNEENEDRVREKTLDLCKNGSIEFLSILGPSDLSESLAELKARI